MDHPHHRSGDCRESDGCPDTLDRHRCSGADRHRHYRVRLEVQASGLTRSANRNGKMKKPASSPAFSFVSLLDFYSAVSIFCTARTLTSRVNVSVKAMECFSLQFAPSKTKYSIWS